MGKKLKMIWAILRGRTVVSHAKIKGMILITSEKGCIFDNKFEGVSIG